MIYTDISVEEWAKRWGLKIVEATASPCGCTIRADVPYLSTDYAGLEARKCCDLSTTTCASAVPISKREIALWNAALSGEEFEE